MNEMMRYTCAFVSLISTEVLKQSLALLCEEAKDSNANNTAEVKEILRLVHFNLISRQSSSGRPCSVSYTQVITTKNLLF